MQSMKKSFWSKTLDIQSILDNFCSSFMQKDFISKVLKDFEIKNGVIGNHGGSFFNGATFRKGFLRGPPQFFENHFHQKLLINNTKTMFPMQKKLAK